jgi:signal transduction histidine kinase
MELGRSTADTMTSRETEQEASRRDQLADLGQLSASVGHLVINAFSAIVSNAELLRSRASGPIDPDEIEAIGNSMIETALDASKVARTLIDWARRATVIDTGQPGREPVLVDMNQLIGELVECEKSSGQDRVEWNLDLTPIPRIAGDPAQLRSMFGHLIRNAREAVPAGAVGRVAFSTQSDPRGWVVVTIRDWGCGMAPEVLKRATEPFFSTKSEQSGVGLTVAQGIWRRHKGALSIDSQPGGGTTIRLSIGPFAVPGQADSSPASIERAGSGQPPTA